MGPDKVRCPYCGQEYTGDMVVGKTQTVSKGVRTICEVVHCSCGKNFRGEVKEEVKLKPRS
jgi:hypothetical protein